MKLRIGITGGIGSGKTWVSQFFMTLGIPVYNADEWAKWLITHDVALVSGIRQLLGDEAYLSDGTYNRAWVANIVFNHPDRLAALNALVHPAVEQHSRDWHEAQPPNVPYTLKEAALMIESGSYRHLDRLIVVTAPEVLRIERVVQRDKSDAANVKKRIQAQLSETERLRYADFVIHNDGMQALIPQVWTIHRALVGLNESNK
jgi:dephospho-CoA kinase